MFGSGTTPNRPACADSAACFTAKNGSGFFEQCCEYHERPHTLAQPASSASVRIAIMDIVPMVIVVAVAFIAIEQFETNLV
jgi:hypothetical protein